MNLDELELELRKLPGIRWAAFQDLGDRLLIQLHAMPGARGDVSLEASRIATRHCEVAVAIDLVRWLPPPPSTDYTLFRANAAVPPPPVPTVTAPPSPPASLPPRPPPPLAVTWTTTPATVASIPDGTTMAFSPRRVQLEIIGVLAVTDTDQVAVHLSDGAARAIGRAPRNHGLVAAVEATLEALRSLPVTLALPVAAASARPLETLSGGHPVVAVALARLGRDECYGLGSAGSDTEAAAAATVDALQRHLRPARRDGTA